MADNRHCLSCDLPMDVAVACWHTGYGLVCSEECARDLIRLHEGGIQRAEASR